ncbi:hypothetical protein CYMTET_40470 [Cymbomonas tetramitiformis]|uniref:Uncharacterized protein n=1 Tax=Cymbomonas tetramitiformis TaxID=36881 RepID=A0AAE0CA32_9CHLO|nr:hypothetical protein CYMTET_40470 [Cymbomonas tetramitiformis]
MSSARPSYDRSGTPLPLPSTDSLLEKVQIIRQQGLPEVRLKSDGPWWKAGKKLGPGGAVGIGCGAGFGLGIVGGLGVGPSGILSNLRLVFGAGAGCGAGIGYGYGAGIGQRWDQEYIQPGGNKHSKKFRTVVQ